MNLKLTIAVCFCALNCFGATYTAATASLSDVKSKVALTVDGDTVNIPAGNGAWSSPLVITNAINLIGAGSNLTIITNLTTGTMLEWKPVNNLPIRMSGIQFGSVYAKNDCVLIYGPDYAVRVDHCLFYGGNQPLVFNDQAGSFTATGPVYGVVDHCMFLNAARAIFVKDWEANDATNLVVGCGGLTTSTNCPGNSSDYGGATEWHNPILPGTTNMVVYEDDVLSQDPNFPTINGGTDADTTLMYGSGGGKRCVRHCTFTGAEEYIDMHGDDPDYSVQYYEVYSNFFSYGVNGTQDNFANQRGGTTIYYGNTWSNYPNGSVDVELIKYWATDYHTVTNSYFWNNGSSFYLYIKDDPTCSGCSSATIFVNHQYFTNAPQSGQTFYPYTPLVYPHPLVGAGGSTNQSYTVTIVTNSNGIFWLSQ